MTSGADSASHAAAPPDTSLADLCEQALAALDHARGRPPLQLQAEVDAAERAVVRLRDALIERLRRDGDAAEAAAWREALKQVNAVLSLVVGLEYPVAREQRKLLDQARDALQAVHGLSAAGT